MDSEFSLVTPAGFFPPTSWKLHKNSIVSIYAGKSVEHDVYSRIKKLEEKILYLEGLSPEYFTNKVRVI